MTQRKDDTPFDAARATKLPSAFFDRSPEQVASELLGCVIATCVGGVTTAGVIVETEAYLGRDDAGSHASTKGVTARNAVMYGRPGTVYVYFTYGNHHMLNLVCEREGVAGAVLIRAIRPIEGIAEMTSRRHGRPLRELCSGPGKLAAALGIDLSDNGSMLGAGRISVFDGQRPSLGELAVSGRIGLASGHELQLRFFVEHDPFVSRGQPGPLRSKRGAPAQRGGTK